MRTIKLLLTLVLLLSFQVIYAQDVKVDLKKSSIKWTASKKVGGSHSGLVQLKEAKIEKKKSRFTKAHFVVDMNTITNTDLKNENYRNKLVGHLKSDDFFAVEKFPYAEINIRKISKFKDGKAKASGKITIKGKTENISFELMKMHHSYDATIEIDRSKFNVRYGSDSFFDNLGDKVINDMFTLNIKIIIME